MNGVFPEQGSSGGGTQVTIVGHHLGGATAVHFGARSALSFIVVDDRTVKAVSPSGGGAVPVSVTTPGGTAMIGYFIYLPVPHLSRAAPGSGPLGGGNPVTLTGVNLYSAESVHFGDTTVFPTVLTDQRLVVVAPAADVPSTVPVYANAVGGVSNRLPYTYAADPTVFGVSPVSGPIVGGTTVLVSGTGLGGVTGVTFGGFSAPSFRSYSGTLMVAVTPPGLTGPAAVTVTTPGGSATLPGAFTFRAESETVVTSGPGPSVSGEPVVFTATVTGIPMTARTPTGTITLEFGDGTPGVTAPLTGGTATVVHAYTGPSADPYTVTASYDGDSDFYASTGTDSRTVARAATITTVVGGVPDPVVFGEAVTLGATVTPLPPGAGVPSGTVTFTVSGTGGGTFTGALDGTGTATVVAGALGTGDHDVSATYDGDAAFTGSTGTGTQTVDRSVTVTRFTTPPNPSVVGETATAVAVVEAVSPGAGIPTGTVTFALSGGESGEVPLDATGTASASGSFPAGVYFSSATYNGDADFAGSDESNIHTVEQASTSTSVVSSPDPSLFGAAVTVTATVAPVAPGAGVPTGSVTYLIDGGGPVDAPLDGSGQALLVTSALAPGGHDITAVYGGDTQFTGSSGSGTQTVAQAGTTTAVVSGPDPSVFGQAVTFTAAVESAGAGAPTGTVVFTVDGPGGGSFTGAVNSAGVAAVTTSGLEAGVHSVTAVYGGDANFTGSTGTGTQTVAEAATSTTVSSSPDPSAFGETVTLAAVVSAVGPGAGTPTGTVSFTVGGVGGGTLTGTVDDSGVATVSTDTLGFGAHAVTAVYNGDADLLSSTASITHSVVTQPSTTTAVTSSPSPSLHGETVVFTAIVAPVAPATGIPTGTVAFVISGSGGGTLTGTLNASGVATVSTGALGAQVHGVTASYSGDSTFDASSSSTTHTVAQAATSTVVLASPGPSVFGQQFAVTATVAAVAPGAGVPTGSVTFRVSGGQTATVSLDAGGTAGFTTSTPVGTGDHTITAVYSGDTDFTTSTGTATQTVGQASTTTRVTSSPDPSTFGQLVTLSATVAPVTPGAGTPTGTVTFTSSSGSFRTVALNDAGIATFTTGVPFQPGTESITAAYNGDTNFAASSGGTAQTVNQAATTTTVASALDPSVFGELVTLSATVVPVLPGAGVPSGVVTFTVGGPGGGILTAPVDSGGSASVGISTLAAGSHSVTAVYSGDAGFATSTGTDSQTVGQASTTTRVTSSPDPSVFGQPVTVTATVAPVTPGAGVPSGAVTFTIDGAGPFDVAVDAAGQASLSNSTLAAGSHTVTAVYNGDGNFTASTGTDSRTVARAATITTVVGGVPDPAVFGEAVTLGATVTPLPPGAGVPSGTVTFTVSGTGGGTFTGALDGTGTATVVAGALGTGDHDVSATYDGDAAFTGSTGTGTQTVDRSVTVTRFTTPPNPSVVGETATAVAVVEAVSPGAGIPTGTVTFALSGGESGEVPLDATGTASASGSFPAGVYFSSATYNGDADFAGSDESNIHTVEQASTSTSVVSSPDPSLFGAAVTVTATVAPVAPGAGVPTGSVTYLIDGGGPVDAPLDGSGQALLVTSALAPGGHDITAVYGGDTQFTGSSGSGTQTVAQAGTTTAVVSGPDPSVFGQAVTFTAAVESAGAGAPTGTVVFTVDGPGGGSFTGAVNSAGVAAVTTSGLEAGVHSVTAVYGGDANFTGSTGTGTQTVAEAATSTTVSSSPDPSAFGETVTLAAVVSAVGPGAGTPTGTVSFTVGGVGGGTLTGTVDDSGVATVSTDTLGFGAHAVTAVYNGDADLLSSTASITHSVVTQPSTTTAVTSSPSPSLHGETVVFTAIVAPVAPATGIPTGTVAFVISGSGGGTLTGTLNASGVATVSTGALGAQVHGVTASYSGDSTFDASSSSTTHTVAQAATSTVVLASPGPSVFGQQFAVTATVAAVAPGAGVPTGSVTFRVSGGQTATVSLDAGGTAGFTTSTPVGTGDHTITAVYSGDTDFTTSTGTATQTVGQASTTTRVTSSPDPSTFGQLVTLGATVVPVLPGAGVPSGVVTFTVGGPGGGIVTAPVDSGGSASVGISTLAAGDHTITAVYSGDTDFATSTGTDSQTVGQASTTTRVTSSPDPSTFGQLVTLGATVVPVLPGAGVPSGVVTFTVGGPGGGILTAPVDSGGSASVGISTLAAGSHSVTAVYSGDAGFATSTGTDSQTVGQASTTTRVTSSPDPSVFGQSVTVTATVAPVTPGAGVPSGAVTFTIDGAGPFDVAVDAAGQASLSNSTLAAGSHTVTAVYNGDGNFTASTGTDSHTVAQAATITTVVGGVPDPAVFGEAVTLGATVTPLPPGAGVPSGTVTFTVSGTGGGTFTGALDGTGTATVVAGALGTGDHDVSATYDGDAAFTGSTGTGTQTVDRSVTVTRFTTPPNPSVVGETATAVAVVEAVSPGAGIPTGTVTFALSGGESGQVPLDATGTASASGSFPVGVYLSSATYNGDANFTESSDSNTHTVGRATTTTTVVSSPDPSRFGQPFTVTATVVPVAPGSGTVTGSVTVTIDGDGGGVFTAPVDATGRATVTTSTPTAGSHSITAVYSGDIDFAGSSGSHSHTVGQATTTTTVASLPAPSRFGQAVTVSARVTAGPPGAGVPTGTVSFTVSGDGGGVFTAPVDSTGLAAVTINTLIVGSHSVSAAYGGDVDFTGSTGTNTLTVTQAATSTTVSSSPDPSAFGETVTLAAVVSPVGPGAGTPTGTVSFTVSGVGGGTLTGTVDASGVATASTDTLGFGAHTVTAVYNGDANLMSSTGSTTHSVVTQPSTVTTVIASPEPSAYGQSVTLSATVNAVPPATGTPTGTVTFTISGSGGGSVPGTLNGSGVATVSTAALGAGTHSVTATYHGDPTFAPSNGSATHTVNQTATSTTVTATPGPSTYGEQVTVSATVAPLTPGAAIPTGTVSFTSSTGSNLTVPLDALGTATYTTASPFQAGTETITATYNGDANFTTSTGSHSHIVNQATTTTTLTSSPDPSVVGQPVTLTAAVAAVPPGAGVPSGTVTFTIGGPGGGTLTATVASGGIATVTTGTLAAGSHTITAVYGGAANFTSSTGSDTQTVNASATTTTVGSAPDPSVVGQSVTLSASVAAVSPGAGVPTGSVAFSIDGAAPVSASLNGSGQATVTTGTLAAGSHTITAVYGGAANFTSSTGSDTQTVNASATTTTVGSAPDPSVVGQSVTLSASVAAVPPGAGIPTGSVTFTLSGTGGGTLTGALDASGVATVTTGTLAAGSHTITAVYGGAANFTSSTGTDTQSVNAQSPTVTSLAPTFGTSAGGTAFTLTGTNLTGAAVTFGGTAVTSVTVNSAGTVLTGTTPAHAAGNAIVQVTTTAGTTTAPGGYTYTLQRVYVTNQNSNSVSVINTLTNLVVGTPVTVGTSPQGVAITPNGATAYVANFASNSVSVIDTGSNTVIKTIPLGTGHGPQGVAVTPNGTRVYVTNQSSNTVSVIDTAANALIGSAITVGSTPSGVAITVDGTRAYVTNFNSGTVSVIDTATNLVVGTPITVGTSPYGVAVAPDRPRAYVTNQNSNSVSAINTSANTVIGAPIPVGTNPRGVAVTPDGTRAYVANFNSGTVSVIDTGPNTVIGSPVAVGANPIGVAITSDGTRAYVTNNGSTTVSVINTTTNLVVGTVTTGTAPDGAAITAF